MVSGLRVLFLRTTRSKMNKNRTKMYFFLVLFSSILAPVLLKNSACRPEHIRIQFLFKFEFGLFIEMPLKLVLCITFAF